MPHNVQTPFMVVYPVMPTVTDSNTKMEVSHSVGVHHCCTKVQFASFQSVGFITVTVVNPLESKLAKRTSVQCGAVL